MWETRVRDVESKLFSNEMCFENQKLPPAFEDLTRPVAAASFVTTKRPLQSWKDAVLVVHREVKNPVLILGKVKIARVLLTRWYAHMQSLYCVPYFVWSACSVLDPLSSSTFMDSPWEVVTVRQSCVHKAEYGILYCRRLQMLWIGLLFDCWVLQSHCGWQLRNVNEKISVELVLTSGLCRIYFFPSCSSWPGLFG